MRRQTNRQQAEIERKYYPGLKLQLFQDFTTGYRLNQSLLNHPGLFKQSDHRNNESIYLLDVSVLIKLIK